MEPPESGKRILDYTYEHESTRPNHRCLTQPTGGSVTDYTWQQTMDQARRMATHLKSLGVAPGARIAILSKKLRALFHGRTGHLDGRRHHGRDLSEGRGHIFFAETLDTFVTDLQRARPTIFVSVPRLWLKFEQGVFQKMPQKKLHLLLSIPIVR